ncbi:MAG: response regulator [Bacteroidetes bacterium]|nr:response regulator [Bacteroidota bacterium]
MNEYRTKLKILAVDDDENNLEVLKVILSEDYALKTVLSGIEALKIIQEDPPDLMLLDIMMPEMNGFEVCKKVRENSDFSTIKIILLSAKRSLDDKLEGYKWGANDYLTKPFNNEELAAKVKVYATLKVEEVKRRNAENKLAENEARFRNILENIENGYFEVNMDGQLTFVNNAFCKIIGYNEDELFRMDNLFFMEKICCFNNQEMLDQLKNGQRMVINVTDCEMKKKDGTLSHVQSSTTLAKDIQGKIIGLRGIIYDITLRKSLEEALKNSNENLQALTETEDLVSTIVLDVKKFTTAMSMSIEGIIIPQLKSNLSHDEEWFIELLNDILEVHTNSIRCTGYLESLLKINNDDEIIEAVDILDIVQQAISLKSYDMMQKNIEWSLNFDQGKILSILGNNQLIRVFMNLIANATDVLLEAETDQPKITITISETEDNVVISIKDNGPGVKPEILNLIRKGVRISKKGKEKSGFDVSGATRIVNQCKGTISINSDLGIGSTFVVELPKSAEVSGDPETEIQLDDSIELF